MDDPSVLTAGPAGPGRLARAARAALRPLDAVFGAVFGSRGNPLVGSGALAILFLAVATATGLYLFLFYRIADPHESVRRIEEAVFLGSWVRGLHRLSADLAIVAAVVHLVRKVVQGHTWGPRAVAWVSGLALLATVLACGWTGLVMVWDVQAQAIAVRGARLIDLLPVFSEPISRSFAGGEAVPNGFFFMNLFLHVAIPLGLAALLWVHVSRVARPRLLPPRAWRRGALAVLAMAAALFPVPLPPAADLLAIPGEVPTDLLFAFWLPVARHLPAGAHLGLWVVVAALALAPPVWAQLRGRRVGASIVHEERCTGCTQCDQDCPYEAISMVPRETPSSLSELVARVDPSRCVGCGICIGSCAPMGVGPLGRTGRDQLREAEAFLDAAGPGPTGVVVMVCRDASAVSAALSGIEGVGVRETGCSGSIHTSVVELMLRRGTGGVFVLTCPPGDCTFREGPKWLAERVWHDREAELRERVDKRRVEVAGFGPGERRAAVAAVTALRDRVRALAAARPEERVDLELECEVPDAVA